MQLWVAIIYLRSFSNQKYLFKRLNVHPREFGNGNFIRSATQLTGPGNVRTGLDTTRNACGASVWVEQGATLHSPDGATPVAARTCATIRHDPARQKVEA
jgi:hypothetical protein